MALLADYCTSAELKSFMRISDAVDDAQVALAVTAASRMIDQAAGRAFGQDDPAVARVLDSLKDCTYHPAGSLDLFAGRWALELEHDISTTTDLVVKVDQGDDGTFETTLTLNTDYVMWPWNAVADGRPYERIVLTSGGSFPSWLRTVQVTAKWGWAAVPTAIKNAALIQAQTILKGGRESPLGIAGSPDFGNELRLQTKLHPIAAEAVRPYVKLWAVV